MICEHCGKSYEIGEWPYCPHGKYKQPLPFSPYWENNFGPEPVYIDSLSKLEREMKQRKLEPIAREHVDDVNERRSKRGLPPLAR